MFVLIDKVIFDSLKELMEDAFGILIDNYISSSKKLIDEIQAEFSAKNLEKVKIAAHSLKSASAQIGALAFSEIAKRIEMAIVNNKTENLSNDINEFVAYYDKLMVELNEIMKNGK